MRKAIQIFLFLFAVGALIVTGISFYRIVLVSSIHGAPVRFVNATAGTYHIKIAFYSDSINAGDVIPFAIAPTAGTQGPLNYVVTATPGPGVSGSLTQSDMGTQPSSSDGTPGSITFVTRGAWTMHIVVNGSAGQGQANLPINAVAPPAMPIWLAWNIGLLPLYGLLVFWIVQVLRKRSPQEARSAVGETPHIEIKSV